MMRHAPSRPTSAAPPRPVPLHQVVRASLIRDAHGKSAPQVADVIAHLAARGPLPSGEARKRLRRIQTYLFNNRHRMAYDAYLAAGFPIATGVIEKSNPGRALGGLHPHPKAGYVPFWA